MSDKKSGYGFKLEPTVLTKAIEGILDEYAKDLDKALDVVLEGVAIDTVNRLKSTKWKNSKGVYNRGWGWTKQESLLKGYNSVIIHNSKQPKLTHLLEYGHASKKGGRDLGKDVPAHPHIQVAQNEAEKKLHDDLMEAIENL